jgi:riboflavin transporter FmnP
MKNIIFVIVSFVMLAAAYMAAFVCEKLLERRGHVKFSSEKMKVNKLVVMSMLAAIAVVLMYFDFPLGFIAPSFYKLDFSEVPVLIGSFMLGPCAGVIIEAVKVILHVCLKGTATAFVGDFANFILGCAYVVPASVVYHIHRTKKMAVISLVVGGIFLVASGTLLNAWYLLPKYSELYGMPIESFIAMGNAINSSINDIYSFVALAVAPFNIIKSVIDGVITVILYKYLSRHLKGNV